MSSQYATRSYTRRIAVNATSARPASSRPPSRAVRGPPETAPRRISQATREPPVVRRSIRRAAAEANERLKVQSNSARRGGGSRQRTVGSSKQSAILLDESSEDDLRDDFTQAPAASTETSSEPTTGEDKAAEKFQCPICLEHPNKPDDVATISGCSHRFCFDCIDRWAQTENKCPLCKERFRTIDRVMPATPAAEMTSAADGGRPQTTLAGNKRKRDESEVQQPALTRNSSSYPTRRTRRRANATETSPRVNSRTVEDRNQTTMASIDLSGFGGLDGSLLHRLIFQTLGRGARVNERRGADRNFVLNGSFRFPEPGHAVFEMILNSNTDSEEESEEITAGSGSSAREPIVFLDEDSL